MLCKKSSTLLAFLSLASLSLAEKDPPKELRDSSIFCEGCYGTVNEIAQMMERNKGKKLGERIEEATGKVCSTDRLRKYVFSPPKMTKVRGKQDTGRSKSNQQTLFSIRPARPSSPRTGPSLSIS